MGFGTEENTVGYEYQPSYDFGGGLGGGLGDAPEQPTSAYDESYLYDPAFQEQLNANADYTGLTDDYGGYGDVGSTEYLAPEPSFWDSLLNKGSSIGSSLLSGGSSLINSAKSATNDKELMQLLGLGAGAAGTVAGYFGKKDDKEAVAARTAAMMAELNRINPSALGEYDPTRYMNPYNQAVKEQTLRDLGIQQAQQAQAQDAAAVSRGAFGGRRADLLRTEGDLQRNLAFGRMAQELDQKGFDTSADIGLKKLALDQKGRESANDMLLRKAGVIGGVPVQASSTSDIGATLAALGALGTGIGARQNPNEVKNG